MLPRLVIAAVFVLSGGPTFAWNALGHKVIAEIAWRQLESADRQAIVGD